MLLAGDAQGRSQRGNNNAYCQDNEISWVSWLLDPEQQSFFEFVCRVMRLRQHHPGFRRRRFFEGRRIKGSGVKDILWINPDGGEMSDEEWNSSHARCLGMFLAASGLEERDYRGARMHDDNLLLLFNAHHETLPFHLPVWESGRTWELILDTGAEGVGQNPSYAGGEQFPLGGRSMTLFRLLRPGPDLRATA